MTDTATTNIATIGLDIAKNVFQLHAADATGVPLVRRKLNRDEVAAYFRTLKPCLVGIEACAGAHYWGRVLSAMGHEVRLIPVQYVKPYVKIHKSDAKDAEAICDAVRRANMRFVPIKSEAQQSALVLHRARSLLVRQKTMLINALRGHLAEFGIVKPTGRAGRREILALPRRLRSKLSKDARTALRLLVAQLRAVTANIECCETMIARWHAANEDSRRLATVPGIGPMTASAIVASIGDWRRFRSGRQFAAWIGLVPRQHSTGGIAKLLGITRAGDRHLRKLLFMGAGSALRASREPHSGILRWAADLRKRKPYRVAIVALAAKLARIAWALLAKQDVYRVSN
jgi:transposase